MIYYIIVMIAVVIFDIVYQKNIKSKRDIIFYIVCLVIAISISAYYYSNPFRNGIAEYILKVFNLGGI